MAARRHRAALNGGTAPSNTISASIRTAFATTFPTITRQAVAIVAMLFAATVLLNEALVIAQPQLSYPGHLVTATIELALCAALAWRPQLGSWLMLALYLAEQWMPLPAASTMTAVPSFILPIIGYRSLPLGMIAAALIALGNYGAPLVTSMLGQSPAIPGAGTSAVVDVSLGEISVNVIVTCCQLLLFAVVGRVMRWVTRQIVNRSALLQREEREQAAMTIHNDICNALSYLQLRVDQRLEDHPQPPADAYRQDYAEFRDVLNATLSQAHHVIAILEQDDRTDAGNANVRGNIALHSTDGNRNATVTISATEAVEQWRSIAATAEDKLHRLGFRGMTILPQIEPNELPCGLPSTAVRLTGELLAELYGNIQKHADTDCLYCITVGLQTDAISIDASDVPAPRDHRSTGTGLIRFQHTIERDGGTLSVSETADTWTLAARIPVADAERIVRTDGLRHDDGKETT